MTEINNYCTGIGLYCVQNWKTFFRYHVIFIFQGVFLFSVVSYKPLRYLEYDYPWWGELIGWMMAMSSIVVMFAYAIYSFVVTPGTFREVCLHISWRSFWYHHFIIRVTRSYILITTSTGALKYKYVVTILKCTKKSVKTELNIWILQYIWTITLFDIHLLKFKIVYS